MSRPLYRRYSLNMKLGGPPSRSERSGEEKSSSAGIGTMTLVSQPLTFFIMDYAFPVPNELEWNWKKRSLV